MPASPTPPATSPPVLGSGGVTRVVTGGGFVGSHGPGGSVAVAEFCTVPTVFAVAVTVKTREAPTVSESIVHVRVWVAASYAAAGVLET